MMMMILYFLNCCLLNRNALFYYLDIPGALELATSRILVQINKIASLLSHAFVQRWWDHGGAYIRLKIISLTLWISDPLPCRTTHIALATFVLVYLQRHVRFLSYRCRACIHLPHCGTKSWCCPRYVVSEFHDYNWLLVEWQEQQVVEPVLSSVYVVMDSSSVRKLHWRL